MGTKKKNTKKSKPKSRVNENDPSSQRRSDEDRIHASMVALQPREVKMLLRGRDTLHALQALCEPDPILLYRIVGYPLPLLKVEGKWTLADPTCCEDLPFTIELPKYARSDASSSQIDAAIACVEEQRITQSGPGAYRGPLIGRFKDLDGVAQMIPGYTDAPSGKGITQKQNERARMVYMHREVLCEVGDDEPNPMVVQRASEPDLPPSASTVHRQQVASPRVEMARGQVNAEQEQDRSTSSRKKGQGGAANVRSVAVAQTPLSDTSAVLGKLAILVAIGVALMALYTM